MANDRFLTDEMVEEEIARLLESPHVKLAKAEQAIKYRRRQYLYKLRGLEKRGKVLENEGFNLDGEEEIYE